MNDAIDALTLARIAQLPCWQNAIELAPLAGGMTNRNYRVRDGAFEYAVRLVEDIAAHGVMRFNELAAARAAHAAGLSPEVVYGESGVLVSRFVVGKTCTVADMQDSAYLPRVVDLVRRLHTEAMAHLRGPVLMFWVPHVIRDYLARLQAAPNNPLAPQMPMLLGLAAALEKRTAPVDIVLGHNDLLAANILDDGQRLWLIDFDYAGLNTPLFDLANLSTNNSFSSEQDAQLLRHYFGESKAPAQNAAFQAMKQASLLREVLWCGVSQVTSPLGIDHTAYTQGCLERLRAHSL
jgi:thiamine kinase-like enzyme